MCRHDVDVSAWHCCGVSPSQLTPHVPHPPAGEYSALMQVLSKLHTGERGLMLQGKPLQGSGRLP